MLQPAALEGRISIAEAARRLKASESTVRQWVADGRLPSANRLDSHGRLSECVILETDFLAFAHQRAALYGVPLEQVGAASVPVSRPGVTSSARPVYAGAVESPQSRGSYIPASWRWADRDLRLVWVTSGLLMLVGAAVLAGWWPG